MILFAAPVIARTDYDGVWNVTVTTKTGSCQPTTFYPLVVTDGSVSGAADLSGTGRNGMVRASLRGAHASGQLSGNAGSGRWNSASAGMPCSADGWRQGGDLRAVDHLERQDCLSTYLRSDDHSGFSSSGAQERKLTMPSSL
jgi:hypothetical protein